MLTANTVVFAFYFTSSAGIILTLIWLEFVSPVISKKVESNSIRFSQCSWKTSFLSGEIFFRNSGQSCLEHLSGIR